MNVPSDFTMSASSTPSTWLFVPEYGTGPFAEAPGPVRSPGPKIHGNPRGDVFRWAFRSSRLAKEWRSPQSCSGIVSWRGTPTVESPPYRPTTARAANARTTTSATSFTRTDVPPAMRNPCPEDPVAALVPSAIVRGSQNRGRGRKAFPDATDGGTVRVAALYSGGKDSTYA